MVSRKTVKELFLEWRKHEMMITNEKRLTSAYVPNE